MECGFEYHSGKRFPFLSVLSFGSIGLIWVPCRRIVFLSLCVPGLLFLWILKEMVPYVDGRIGKSCVFTRSYFLKYIRHVEFDTQFTIYTLHRPKVHEFFDHITCRFIVANIRNFVYLLNSNNSSEWYDLAVRILFSVWRAQAVGSWLCPRNEIYG